MPNPNVNPIVKSLDTIKCDTIRCLWKDKKPKPRGTIGKNNKDMAKSSKTVIRQMRKCDQIKMTYNFFIKCTTFFKRLLT